MYIGKLGGICILNEEWRSKTNLKGNFGPEMRCWQINVNLRDLILLTENPYFVVLFYLIVRM